MAGEIRENTRALYELKEAIVLQTEEIKHQTEYIKEQFDNGFVEVIVDKIAGVFYKTTKVFGFIVLIGGGILYFLLR